MESSLAGIELLVGSRTFVYVAAGLMIYISISIYIDTFYPYTDIKPDYPAGPAHVT